MTVDSPVVDVVVVGAGAAGCVVARVLADQGLSVQLVEAGSADRPEAVSGLDALAAVNADGWTWPGDYVRGRGLGGGSAVNGLVMMAGDTDLLRLWGGEPLVVSLNKMVDRLTPVPHRHGPVATAFRQASRAAGHRSSPSSAVPDQTGLMTAALAMAGGGRRSAADCLLTDAPVGLEVLTDTEVVELIGNGRTVTGVRTADGRSFTARHTVLSAGALVSPSLLLAAGLGNEHVGRGLKDHPSVAFTLSLATPESPPVVATPPITAVLRWSSGRQTNDLVTVPVESNSATDGYGIVLTAAMVVATEGVVTAEGYSFGRLQHADDRSRLRTAVRGTAELLASDAMAAVADQIFIDERGTTLDQLPVGDAELDDWMMEAPDGLYHAGSSCRLGSALGDGGQVVDASGVSVIDASVLPDLPRANPQLTVMAVAAHLAEQLATSLSAT